MFNCQIDEASLARAEPMVLVIAFEDLALAEVVRRYKALADIERGFKVLKSEIEIAPVFHRLPERIKAHASTCFMALILYLVMRQRLNLTICDAAVTPTRWQWSRHPEIFRPKITVQHEGIATHELGPDPQAEIVTPNGTRLKAGDPVITYVARNLEPYRGFHVFMRALELVQQANPHCHAVVIGGDEVSYCRRPTEAANWREHMLREVQLDPQRTHFLGRVPRAHYIKVMQVSAVHVYLTYPFVLSWSLLEAMACGAPIVGSDTAPVREVIRDGVNGSLVEFFDPESIAQAVQQTLGDRVGAMVRAKRSRDDVHRLNHAEATVVYERLIGHHTMPSAKLQSDNKQQFEGVHE